ncbi:MAG: PASTA domain-containing protein [Bacilli bacterium]|nr:PASTA domain-containing protein [Bacilli bacterium]
MKKLIFIFLFLVFLVGCSNKSIVGTWYYAVEDEVISITFNSDNTCVISDSDGNYECTYDDKTITTKTSDYESIVNYEVYDDYIEIKAEIIDVRFYKSEEEAKKYDEENRVTVPDVTNMSLEEAERVLIKSRLTVGLPIPKASDEIEKGHVIYTSPEKGKKVSRLTEVMIYYSSGSD